MPSPVTPRGAAAASLVASPPPRAGGAGELGKQDFLQLLVAQLRNQDPLRPMEDREFITQLAQFRTLETMINLEERVQALAAVQVFSQATALIGKTVEAQLADGTRVVGVVTEVSLTGDSPRLLVDGQAVELSQIVAVRTPGNTLEAADGSSRAARPGDASNAAGVSRPTLS